MFMLGAKSSVCSTNAYMKICKYAQMLQCIVILTNGCDVGGFFLGIKPQNCQEVLFYSKQQRNTYT